MTRKAMELRREETRLGVGERKRRKRKEDRKGKEEEEEEKSSTTTNNLGDVRTTPGYPSLSGFLFLS